MGKIMHEGQFAIQLLPMPPGNPRQVHLLVQDLSEPHLNIYPLDPDEAKKVRDGLTEAINLINNGIQVAGEADIARINRPR